MFVRLYESQVESCHQCLCHMVYTQSVQIICSNTAVPTMFNYDHNRNVIVGAPKLECCVGEVKLIVKFGDITKETCDAIVNSTNEKLDVTVGMYDKSSWSIQLVNYSDPMVKE